MLSVSALPFLLSLSFSFPLRISLSLNCEVMCLFFIDYLGFCFYSFQCSWCHLVWFVQNPLRFSERHSFVHAICCVQFYAIVFMQMHKEEAQLLLIRWNIKRFIDLYTLMAVLVCMWLSKHTAGAYLMVLFAIRNDNGHDSYWFYWLKWK